MGASPSTSFIFYCLFFLFFLGTTNGFKSEDYDNSKQLLPFDYTVYWRVSHSENALYLALKVKTTGWVGFGIAEYTSGSMPGADIIIGKVENGVGSVSDRWSSDRVTPDIDSCQDVTLIAAEETSDGYTILEVKRSINTTDPQDRPIAYGPNRIIAAFGTSDNIAYHNTNRRTDEITFFGGPIYTSEPDSNSRTIDLRIDNFLVPDMKTRYVCQTFAMPTDDDYYITQIDPIVNQDNVAHVHHFVAHVCENFTYVAGNLSYVDEYQHPQGCMPLQGQIPRGCVGLLSAWAAGGGSQYTPPEAGFPMGKKSTSIKFIILEVHYNNPNGIGGYTDNSGIRLHYTKTPRQFEADVLIIGDPFTSFPVIPANSQDVDFEAECREDCTQSFPEETLHVFQSFPHMHQAGRKAWSTQWRNNNMIREIGRIEYFSYDHQQVQEVNFTIQRGDRFNTHCVYNTQGINEPTKFGMDSTDEMCMHFLFYYPRMYATAFGVKVPHNFCGRFYYDGSICGGSANYNFSLTNPVHIDPPGGINTRFGLTPDQCPIEDSSSSLLDEDSSSFLLPLLSLVSFALLVVL